MSFTATSRVSSTASMSSILSDHTTDLVTPYSTPGNVTPAIIYIEGHLDGQVEGGYVADDEDDEDDEEGKAAPGKVKPKPAPVAAYEPLVQVPLSLPAACARLSHLDLYTIRDYCLDLGEEIKQAQELLGSIRRDTPIKPNDVIHAAHIESQQVRVAHLHRKKREWEIAFHFALKYKKACFAGKGRALFFPNVPTKEIRESGFDQPWEE